MESDGSHLYCVLECSTRAINYTDIGSILLFTALSVISMVPPGKYSSWINKCRLHIFLVSIVVVFKFFFIGDVFLYRDL